jgi:hypothetical protein
VKVWINRGEIFGRGLNNQNIPPKIEPRSNTRFNRRRSFANPNAEKGESKEQ